MRMNRRKIVYGKSKRPLKQFRSRVETVFLTGSIGDVLAIESFLSDEIRATLSTILYATQKQKTIESLFCAIPNYGNLRSHITVWKDFSNMWCFMNKNQCVSALKAVNVKPSDELVHAVDYSICRLFPLFNRGEIKYNNSSFIKHKLADIKIDLPAEYYVICPYSTDKRIKERDFDNNDWKTCVRYLEIMNCKGLVLNEGRDTVPVHERLVDYSNLTSICEAIEILKGAKGYLGIDSSLSVLATKLFDYPQLIVKSRNSHCYDNRVCYYSPQTDFSFMKNKISIPKEML